MTRSKGNKLALAKQVTEPAHFTCSLDISEPLDAPWQFTPNDCDRIVQVSYEPPVPPAVIGRTRIWLLLHGTTLTNVLDEML